MRNFKFVYFLIGLLGVFSLTLLSSCQDDITDDAHYSIPSWLKGNAYQVLEKEGNYKIFLKGVDLADFKPILNGKSIVTVMAPDDSAFTAYLKDKGYNSISEMSKSQLRKLIGFHLMYYAFDWDKLVNFRPDFGDGATDEDKAIGAGYYYKFRTKSKDSVSVEYDPATDTSYTVYHLERFLPVFSYKMFETKGIDAKSNYEYFYPNSEWTGGSNGFNVSNASVNDSDAVITNNGYLYHVNQVLDPLETVYTELKNDSSYSTYFNMYNSYSTYTLDDDLTSDYGNGTDLYLHEHGALPNIACEWPVSSYLLMSILSRSSYNVFAPSNIAIDKIFNTYWKPGGYSDLNDLDPLIKEYFIMQSFGETAFIAFPEEINNGEVQTVYGTPVNINTDNVTLRKICANGTLYGMDDMPLPMVFSSIAGPAFKYKSLLPYMYILAGSDLVLSLSSQESEFVALMPDTAQCRKAKIRFETENNEKVLKEYSDESGDYETMSSTSKKNIVNMHIASGVSSLEESNPQIVETNTAFNYWYVYNDSITTNSLFNGYLNPDSPEDFNPFVKLTELKNDGQSWNNGRVYKYDYDGLFSADAGDGLEYDLAICNDKRYQYYLFSQLLKQSGLVKDNAITLLMEDTRFIVFIPTNEAIKNGIKNIPGCSRLSISDDFSFSGSLTSTNKAKLANWLRSLFITSDLNTFTSYPYPGSGVSGTFDTYGNEKLQIIDDGSSLSINFSGNDASEAVPVISKYHYLPFAFSDGAFHLISGIPQ